MNRLTTVFLSLVIAVAVIGYFVGIGDGVPQPDGFYESSLVDRDLSQAAANDVKLIPAVSYSEISSTPMGPTKSWQAKPQALPGGDYDLYTKIEPSEAEKEASGKLRASRRSFNGAPPIIPHPVENTTDAACYACHSNGVQMAGLKASVMSHKFLGNCVQCHAPMAPVPFQDVDASVETSFVGLPAPTQGKRAFQGAPPTIPHSQWMRENCNACHGGPNGWAGLESTHPWRTNCTQCHAPSATLDQMPEAEIVPMLPPLDVVRR
ncbi:Nitrate reductase cytochrome c-type subunit (NapB) [Rubripirellula obstinata]|uniref:Nitrate reductase cytochrome c-type subunit (NapB) n=1 Tax=Rubripirellula obstinata TaxID=406547 RepID=A0A5B1CEY9_9BACT|nr:diheme cytochrome c precursor [Rubripirellula obstinata]KAA1258445.1 Nitrate reductase cytochrome c-type subunit (NapB) [Rubripirellula obstinata]